MSQERFLTMLHSALPSVADRPGNYEAYIHIWAKLSSLSLESKGSWGTESKALRKSKKNSSYFMVSLQVLEPIMCHMQKCRDSQLSLLESPLAVS